MLAADLGAADDSGQAQEAHLPQKPHHLLLPHQIPQIGATKIAFPTLTVGQLITHWLEVSCFSNNTAYSPVRLWSPEARLQASWILAGFLGTEGSKLMKLCKVYIGIHVVDPRPQTCARDARASMSMLSVTAVWRLLCGSRLGWTGLMGYDVWRGL